MSTTTGSQYATVAVAARLLNLSAETVRGLFDRGALDGIRSDAGYRLIDMDSIENYSKRKHLTVSEAATRLGVSRETVTKRFDTGELGGYRTPAGHRLIDPAALT
jgi:excisionase family DNA binding protein